MKQVSQRLRDGRIEVLDVPVPELRPEGVLVELRASLISTGTERSTVETARRNLVGKARSRPDQVRQVLDAARQQGIADTVRAVNARLSRPSPLGYSAAGVVVAVGSRVSDLVPGDRVACGGGGYASHAEVDYVPANLCVPLPESVAYQQGAFGTVGAIALHGVRQADVRLGERVAVIGLGLVGQVTARILRAAGCYVVAIDLSPELVERARAAGASAGFVREALDGDIPAAAAECDAVVITAATTSADPVQLAARLARDRGRVVVVGDVRMDVPRGAYYEKELDVRISRSYGPGRYDAEYEEKGLDYPIGYVRWTERRNMAAFVELLASRSVEVDSLVTEAAPVEEAPAVYERLLGGEAPALALVLTYDGGSAGAEPPSAPAGGPATSGTRAAVIGTGGFAARVLLPALKGAGFDVRAVASARGVSAWALAGQFAVPRAVSVDEALRADDVDVVVVATRHGSHAALGTQALRAGKAVFLEKPPALTDDELEGLREARAAARRHVAVGFNRRYAALARALRHHVRRPGIPVELLIRVNAGRLPDDHWVNDVDEGGGRLLGEGCHFVDLACWFVGRLPGSVTCAMRADPGRPLAAAQSFAVTLAFDDGSLASVLYAADGASGLGKEYVEAHSGGRSGVLDDFRSLALHGAGRDRTLRARTIDKGHRRQFTALRAVLRGAGAEPPDPLDTMQVTLDALRSAATGAPVLRLDGSTPRRGD